MEANKILFFKERNTGEILEATLDFLKINWRPILKMGFLVFFPLALLQGWMMDNMMGTMMSRDFLDGAGAGLTGTFWFNYAGTIITYTVGSLFSASLAMALLMTYNERPQGLDQITFGDIKSLFTSNLWRQLILTLVTFVLFIAAIFVVGILIGLSAWTLLITIPLMIWAVVSYVLSEPVYLLERQNVFSSVARGFRLGMANWWMVFAVVLILSIIVSIISSVVSMPMYAVVIARNLLGGNSVGMSATLMGLLSYVGAIITSFFNNLTSMILIIAVAYIYGHAAERKDGITIEEDIEKFDTL